MPLYFCYDQEEGFETFTSEEAAEKDAAKRFALWKNQAIIDGEWADEASSVCWGRLIGDFRLTEEPADEDGKIYFSGVVRRYGDKC